jgi:hypothetical protein
MTTAWSHLPNAAHIDKILADVKANPNHWDMPRLLERENIKDNILFADAAGWAWYMTQQAIYKLAYGRSYRIVFDAMLALITWDNISKYLDMPSSQVLEYLILDNKAVLMLPAVLAFEKSKELV